jgi:hypothetical protein
VTTAAVGRSAGQAVGLALMLLTARPPDRLTAQAAQQTDSIRREALTLAQTRPDSARALVRRLLARTSSRDSLYPGVLLTAGRLAADAPTVATYLQRVVVEYGRSVWADSALLLLTQLDFAQGDPAATVQAAERMRRDYPDSPLKPRVAFWGGRAYFDLKDDAHGCALIQEALSGSGDDVEFKNQVVFYAARCGGQPAPTATPGPPEGAPSATAPQTPPRYAVQLLAVKSAPQVDELLSRLKVMGFEARVVRDTSGLFKVRVGHYATREAALRAQRRLKTRLGGRPFVVEEP